MIDVVYLSVSEPLSIKKVYVMTELLAYILYIFSANAYMVLAG